jgi:hypothetical protein
LAENSGHRLFAQRIATLTDISENLKVVHSWTLPSGVLVLLQNDDLTALQIYFLPNGLIDTVLPPPIFSHRTSGAGSTTVSASLCFATRTIVVVTLTRYHGRVADLSDAQVLSIVLDETMATSGRLEFEVELKENFAPLRPQSLHRWSLEFQGVALNENGENGAFLFLRSTHGYSDQFVVIFKITKAIRTILLPERINGRPLRFSGSVLWLAQIEAETARLFAAEILTDRILLSEDFGRHAPSDGERLPVLLDVAGEQRMLTVKFTEGRFVLYSSCQRNAQVAFAGIEIGQFFVKMATNFGGYDIWSMATGFPLPVYGTCYTNCSEQSFNEELLKSGITYAIVNSNLPLEEKIAASAIIVKLLTVPTPLSSGQSRQVVQLSMAEVLPRFAMSFSPPPLLVIAPSMSSFVVTVISECNLRIIRGLTGIEFGDVRENSVVVGANFLPTLTIVVGLLITAAVPLDQAIAFIAAISVSSTVIVSTNDFTSFWNCIVICCDHICDTFSFTFAGAVNVLVLGPEAPLDVFDAPESSAIHRLKQVCRFHFSSDETSYDPQILIPAVNSRPTPATIVGLRKVSSFLQARWSDPREFITAHMLFEDAEKARSTDIAKSLWLCKIAESSNDIDAQYALGTRYGLSQGDSLRHLLLAAERGNPDAQWRVFEIDPTRIDLLDQAVEAGHPNAIIAKSLQIPEFSAALPFLLHAQSLGSEVASTRIFEHIHNIPPVIALQQARHWLSTDPERAFLFYRSARANDFRLYRSILVACNNRWQMPEVTTESELRSLLSSGNKLAAAKLAALVDETEKRNILESGLPAYTAYAELAQLPEVSEDPDLLYEYCRDGILASPTVTSESNSLQDCLLAILEESSPAKRVEIATLILDHHDTPFTHDPAAPLTFLCPADGDPPDLLRIAARVYGLLGDRSAALHLLQQAHSAASDNFLRGAIEFDLLAVTPSSEHLELLEQSAAHGFPKAHAMRAVNVLLETHLTDEDIFNVAQSLRFASTTELSARFPYSLLLAVGAWGLPRDLTQARALWRDINIRDINLEIIKHGPLGRGIMRFALDRMLNSSSDEEFVRAIYIFLRGHCAAEIPKDLDLRMVMLKELYMTPRFKATKELATQLLPILLTMLRMDDANRELYCTIFDRFMEDPPDAMDEATAADMGKCQRKRFKMAMQ